MSTNRIVRCLCIKKTFYDTILFIHLYDNTVSTIDAHFTTKIWSVFVTLQTLPFSCHKYTFVSLNGWEKKWLKFYVHTQNWNLKKLKVKFVNHVKNICTHIMNAGFQNYSNIQLNWLGINQHMINSLQQSEIEWKIVSEWNKVQWECSKEWIYHVPVWF